MVTVQVTQSFPFIVLKNTNKIFVGTYALSMIIKDELESKFF